MWDKRTLKNVPCREHPLQTKQQKTNPRDTARELQGGQICVGPWESLGTSFGTHFWPREGGDLVKVSTDSAGTNHL